ncbi:MAG TPA: DNA methyltransferase [Verrucomicrobiota bacterium]|nr:DNA methyltransferase [Verrucomicrobiota bacterium]
MSPKSLEHHPIADRFPLLNGPRFEELVRDLQDHGLREPITLYEGMILDGRNRYRACRQLGIEPQTRALPDGLDPWAYVWSLNGQRRDLSADQRYLIWKRVTEGSADWQSDQERRRAEANRKRAEATQTQPRTEDGSRLAAKSGPNTTCVDTSRTASEINPAATARAASSKTNRGAVQRGDFLDAKRPDLAEQVIQGQTTMAAAIREARRAEHARQLEAACAQVTAAKRQDLAAVCDLRHCSCAELFASGVRPDVVITDPPYPKEFLPLYADLAKGCAAAHVPLVAVMVGQTYLPDILAILCAHLTYRWTLAYLTPGGQAVQQWSAKVNTFWKPVLLFGSGDWIGDVARSDPNDNDKRWHDWGQSQSGMLDLVGRLSAPGQLVCDPFLGAGTTAVAALALGRRFVGCDIDPEALKRATQRVQLV